MSNNIDYSGNGFRYRTVEDTPIQAPLVFTRSDPGPSPNQSSTSTLWYPGHSGSRSMRDIVTPRFASIQARGGIVNNPMGQSIVKYDGTSSGLVTGLWTGGSPPRVITDSYSGAVTQLFLSNSAANVTDTTDYTPVSEADYIASAKQQAMSRLSSSDFSFGEDIGELRESLKTLRSPLSSARDIADDLSEAYRKRLRSWGHVRAMSKTWLAYRYEFRPLILSAVNVFDAINRNVNRSTSKRYTARGFQHARNSSNGTLRRWDTVGWDRSFSVAFSDDLQVRAGILYQSRTWRNSGAAEYGLGLRDIVPTIWALMPYSWVVDRFIDINAGLYALEGVLDPSLEMLAGWVSTTRETRTTRRLTGISYTSYSSCSGFGNLVEESTKTKNRTPWVPSVDDAFFVPSFKHLVDSATSDLQFTADLASLVVTKLSDAFSSGRTRIHP